MLAISLYPLVFTDVLNTNCPQEANCIIVGHIVVVNNCPIESRVLSVIPGFFVNNRPPHINGNAACHCHVEELTITYINII